MRDYYEAIVTEKLSGLLESHPDLVIVGVTDDWKEPSVAERFCRNHDVPFVGIPCEWGNGYKGAAYEACQQAQKFLRGVGGGVLAFWDGKNRTTSYNFLLAEDFGNALEIVRTDRKGSDAVA